MLESIFNTSQDGFLVLKAIHSSAGVIADFAISRVNSKAEELLGDTSAKLLGRLIKLEVPSFVTSGLYDLAKNTVLSKEPFDVEQYFDESTMLGWYRITGVALDDGIVINISDISDSKNAQMELDRKVEELIKASEAAEMATVAKSEFLAAMSHEIRTPMTGVMGFADMLLEDNLDDASKEKIFKIKDVTRSLLKIINDILDMSKLEVGKMEVEYLDFHLPSLIKESVGLFHEKRKGKRAKNLDLNVSFADGFPDAINSDPTRFRQILINLIGNAVKFTKTGSVTVKCQLKRSNNGKEFIYVEVIDTGIGISADVIKRLFTAFTQADSSISRQYEGTGLGLSICKRLVELMGGDIGAQSELGKGSTFWFSVPFKAATSEVSQSYQDTVYQSISYRALRPLNILVAEDNEINQQIIKATLDRFGHKSHITENGIAAVKAHKQGNFDLILMDVRMPEMSGPEATQAIRQLGEDKSRIPIIAVTADAVEANIKGYFDAGMNAVVTKPIDRADLATSIDKVMGETIHRPEVSTETGSSASKDETKADDVDEEDVKSAVDDFLKQIGAT